MNGSAVRRLLLGGLIGYWLLAASPVWCAEPVVSAAGALLLDAETGQVLWEQDGYTPRPPASTTKILTALLCLDIAPLDREVTVTPAASAVGESSAGLLAGEDFVLGELLNAALLKSANDACYAIAEGAVGSEPYFVHLMNTKAGMLGADNAVLVNTNGLPDDRHVMSCYDLALLARSAMQNAEFRSRVGSVYGTMHGGSYDRSLKNTNKLLVQNEYVTGIKTGTTNTAGACLVSSMERDGRSVIAVVLDSKDRYADSLRLLNYGIDGFGSRELVREGQYLGVFAAAEPVPVRAAGGLRAVLPVEADEVRPVYHWRQADELTAVAAGEAVGTLEFCTADGGSIGSVNLLAAADARPDRWRLALHRAADTLRQLWGRIMPGE